MMVMIKKSSILLAGLVFNTMLVLSACSMTPIKSMVPNYFGSSVNATINNNPDTMAYWTDSTPQVWNKVSKLSSAKLKQISINSQNSTQKAWVDLALISKQKNLSSKQIAILLLNWQQNYPTHPGNAILASNADLELMKTQATPQKIALLIPQSGPYARLGNAVKQGILSAYQLGGASQNIVTYNTASNQSISQIYQKAVSDGADFIIGPLLKDDVKSLMNNSFPVKTLALNYTDNIFFALPENLYQFGLLPDDEITQMANQAHKNGLNRALIIASNDERGQRLYKKFSDQWQNQGGQVIDSLLFNSPQNLYQTIPNLLHINIKHNTKSKAKLDMAEIQQMRRKDFDVIFIFAEASQGQTIVPLLRFYSINHTPIYASSSIISTQSNSPTSQIDLNGVTICDIPSALSSSQLSSTQKLIAVGQDAYRISQSIERLQLLPQLSLYGATGALDLSNKHQIHRRLPCQTINANN